MVRTAYNRAWRVSHPSRLAYEQEYDRTHREQKAYADARRRCQNPEHPVYGYYGARGIEFRFVSFAQFMSTLGPRPEGMTLDRIDNDGHYEPGNVRWATRSQQQRNKR